MDYDTKEKKLRKFVPIASTALYLLFRVWEHMTRFENYNYPQNDKGVIFAMWHHDQMCIDAILKQNRAALNILISKSIDGELISQATQKMGFSSVRGSRNKKWKDKGGKEAAFEMITKLKEGQSVAITVDGPTGPLHKVKKGVIKIAKHTGAPIIPVFWYSPSRFFGSIPTWDKIKIPLWFVKTVNIFGEPVYISEDADIEEEKQTRKKLQRALLNLENNAKEVFEKVYKI